MIAVKFSMPNIPRFDIVNVPPKYSSIASLPSLAFLKRGVDAFESSTTLRFCESLILGTIRPVGDATAIPRLTLLYLIIVSPTRDEFISGYFCSAMTVALTCQNINNVEAIDVFDGSHAVTAHYGVPEQLTGYEYEVASAAQAMLDGRTECDEMPHSDTLRIMECMDSLRADWGLKYPFEA